MFSRISEPLGGEGTDPRAAGDRGRLRGGPAEGRARGPARARPGRRPGTPLLCSADLGCRRPEGDHGAPPTRLRPRRERGFFVRADCEDSTMEIEIGRGKKGRRAYGFDDIAIVPSRRTRDPDDIDIS